MSPARRGLTHSGPLRWGLARWAGGVLRAGALLGLGGCSVFSPLPLWELAKAGGAVAQTSLAWGQSQSSQTVRHSHLPYRNVCIEYNRDCQVADLLPALQSELLERRLSSRVYEQGVEVPGCEVWLRYEAYLQWGTPPLRERHEPYLQQATLSLHAPDGRLVVVSRYQLDGLLEIGKWSSTRRKLAPVVSALLTGHDF